MDMNKVAVFRREHFCAAHRLHNDKWDEETNNRIFGKCNNPSYHGHNYELEIKVTGVPDVETGFVIDEKRLSDLIKEKIKRHFDHRNLNLDVADFKNLNPTVENIAIVIYNRLRNEIASEHDLRVRVYETPRNYAEYPA